MASDIDIFTDIKSHNVDILILKQCCHIEFIFRTPLNQYLHQKDTMCMLKEVGVDISQIYRI